MDRTTHPIARSYSVGDGRRSDAGDGEIMTEEGERSAGSSLGGDKTTDTILDISTLIQGEMTRFYCHVLHPLHMVMLNGHSQRLDSLASSFTMQLHRPSNKYAGLSCSPLAFFFSMTHYKCIIILPVQVSTDSPNLRIAIHHKLQRASSNKFTMVYNWLVSRSPINA